MTAPDALLADSTLTGTPLCEDLGWRRRRADLDSRILALEALSYALLDKAEAGQDPAR